MSPATIEGTPSRMSTKKPTPSPTRAASGRVGRGVVDEERGEDAERGREERREPHQDERPDEGARDAARRVGSGGGSSVKKLQEIAGRPLTSISPSTSTSGHEPEEGV